jgi:hypothetical protein
VIGDCQLPIANFQAAVGEQLAIGNWQSILLLEHYPSFFVVKAYGA